MRISGFSSLFSATAVFVIQFLSEDLKDDMELVGKAVSYLWWLLGMAGERCRGNGEIVMQAATRHHSALQHAARAPEG